MPFGPLRTPSLGLSLIQAGLLGRGIQAEVKYFTLEFAQWVGVDRYDRVVGHRFNADMLGEWIFAEALRGPRATDLDFVEQILLGGNPAHAKGRSMEVQNPLELIQDLVFMKGCVGSFLDACEAKVLSLGAGIVGFTSVFEQTAPSLALAKRLKEKSPEIQIAFGGANAEGEMGRALFQAYPFLDLVVSGEAEHAFPKAVEIWRSRGKWPQFPGFSLRDPLISWKYDESPQAPRSLDDLPRPDFSTFFRDLESVGLEQEGEVVFETSRGCWWGQKQHCTFCGLNGDSMAFRSKSPERAYAELTELAAKYPGRSIEVVDNILDLSYFRTLLPRLAEDGPAVDLFWEVKANLTEPQLRLLKAAGVRRIQPGIESLSDDGLALMRKGVSALQNLQLLKLCAELGMDASWNILVGFPGEDPSEVLRVAELMPLLHHLKPPTFVGRIRLDRFSPNFSEALERGLVNIQAYPSYGFIHDLPQEQLDRLAYYFTFDYALDQNLSSYLPILEDAWARWKEAFPGPRLVMVDHEDRVTVIDNRSCSKGLFQGFHGLEAEVLRNTHTLIHRDRLYRKKGSWATLAEVDCAIDALKARNLLVERNDILLGLPLQPGRAETQKGIPGIRRSMSNA